MPLPHYPLPLPPPTPTSTPAELAPNWYPHAHHSSLPGRGPASSGCPPRPPHLQRHLQAIRQCSALAPRARPAAAAALRAAAGGGSVDSRRRRRQPPRRLLGHLPGGPQPARRPARVARLPPPPGRVARVRHRRPQRPAPHRRTGAICGGEGVGSSSRRTFDSVSLSVAQTPLPRPSALTPCSYPAPCPPTPPHPPPPISVASRAWSPTAPSPPTPAPLCATCTTRCATATTRCTASCLRTPTASGTTGIATNSWVRRRRMGIGQSNCGGGRPCSTRLLQPFAC